MSTALARRYTYGLFAYAKEHGVIDVVEQGLQLIADSLKQYPEFKSLVEHPLIPLAAKVTMMQEVFGAHIDPVVLRFFKLLLDHGRSDQLLAVAESFHELAQESQGLVEVRVETALAFDSEQVALLEQQLSAVLNKQAKAVVEVNPSLIAGYRVKVGNRVIDATVQGTLQQFSKRLLHNGALAGAGV